MQVVVIVAGAIAEATGWLLVARKRAPVWVLMPVVLGAMGLAAILARRPVAAADMASGAVLAVGLASGLVLYAATRVVVAVVARWEPLRRAVAEQYREATQVTRVRALVLSVLVMVPAEELFWRGLMQARLAQGLGAAAAAGWTWLAYVSANAASASIPITAGAVVGGALWVGLAAWSGGMLASLASHMLWTGLMLALPPGAGRGVRGA